MVDYPDYLKDAIAGLMIDKIVIKIKEDKPCIENAPEVAEIILSAIANQYHISPRLPPMEQNNG